MSVNDSVSWIRVGACLVGLWMIMAATSLIVRYLLGDGWTIVFSTTQALVTAPILYFASRDSLSTRWGGRRAV